MNTKLDKVLNILSTLVENKSSKSSSKRSSRTSIKSRDELCMKCEVKKLTGSGNLTLLNYSFFMQEMLC